MFRGLDADVYIGLSEEDQLKTHIADLRAFSATEVKRISVAESSDNPIPTASPELLKIYLKKP